MRLLQRFRQLRHQKPLGMRLLAAILLYSSAITLIATGTQLWLDYRYELSAIDERLLQIEASSRNSLANSLWEISPAQIQVQLDGLLQLPDVRYLEINSSFNDFYVAGSKPTTGAIVERRYALEHHDADRGAISVGELTLILSLDEVYRRLADKVLVILASQGIKTFLVSIFILTLFHRLITQHLGSMAAYARRLKLEHLGTPLDLKRNSKHQGDELSQVVDAMNSMRRSMLHDMSKREDAERSLAKLNTELEQRVVDRTKELEERNQELHDTLATLRSTQQQLVESEKLAALGGLVAGVAHEINTPIGIGFTAASFLADQAHLYQQHSPNDPLANTAVESSRLICQNLERAAQLINAFKLVSVDQSSEQCRRFDLIQYLDEVLLSLNPRLKQCKPDIAITGPKHLMIDSYPGCYYQVLTNMILNSLIHGFEDRPGGVITIDVKADEDNLIIDYRDNGVGIPKDWQYKVFEPFMTTKRNEGCSGLGMHIAFNLVSQLLQGHISCLSDTSGAHFRLELPMVLVQKPLSDTPITLTGPAIVAVLPENT
ncbi:ATP-binding protein [Neptunomonas japonica]|uniref:histidine kinase n=1 Tax=Neptunomonas japonica JAMM 1380 TaxID=1441457 RepID=A0A7R6SWL4_9GAMM|nr:ATP-binding protein [Neptunomonas japonica]BBB29837.1 two-component system sensor histidine kinase [Neptunomonas japonica JAMM 1380]